MPFNGSGVFTRVYNWVNDAAAAINITASRVDTEDDGFATGLSNCICKDGQTTITANLPMSTFRHTGVGNAVARTDYAAAGQVQDGGLVWVAAGGTANAITATYSPAITTLVDGMKLRFRASAANSTTTPTFSPNGLTARTITKKGGSALAANDIPAANAEVEVTYNLANTRWELSAPATIVALVPANNLSDVSNAATSLSNLGGAPLASPTFTGTPSLPTGTTGVTQSASDNSTKLATTAFTKTAISTFANIGTTAATAMAAAGGLITIAHGKSSTPYLIIPSFKCTSTEGGWSTNDVVSGVWGGKYDNNFQASNPHWMGGSCYADATNVYMRVGDNAVSLPRKDTGVGFAITTGNWNVILTYMY